MEIKIVSWIGTGWHPKEPLEDIVTLASVLEKSDALFEAVNVFLSWQPRCKSFESLTPWHTHAHQSPETILT